MDDHFYHIRGAPLSDTIFITHMRILPNGRYANGKQCLSLGMLDNFSCLCCHMLTFFKINLFKKFLQEYYKSVKEFGSRSGPAFSQS